MYKPSTVVQTLVVLYIALLGSLDESSTEERRKLTDDTYKALLLELVRDNPEFTRAEINGWIMEQLKGE